MELSRHQTPQIHLSSAVDLKKSKMIFKTKKVDKVDEINKQVTDTHKRPSLGKKVASAIRDAKQALHNIADRWKNRRSHTSVGEKVDKRLDTCTVPSVDDSTHQVEETCPSGGASPNEERGMWKMLKRLKERIRVSRPAIRNAFKKIKKAIKEGCEFVFGLLVSPRFLLGVCLVFASLFLLVSSAITGCLPWYIPAFLLLGCCLGLSA